MGNAGSAPVQPNNSVDGAAAAEARRAPPSTVRFFPDAERQKARQPPPIKLEEEEGAPPPPATEEEMAPRNLWQVLYAAVWIYFTSQFYRYTRLGQLNHPKPLVAWFPSSSNLIAEIGPSSSCVRWTSTAH